MALYKPKSGFLKPSAEHTLADGNDVYQHACVRPELREGVPPFFFNDCWFGFRG